MTKLRIQTAIIATVSVMAGIAIGLYIASQTIGDWMPEVIK